MDTIQVSEVPTVEFELVEYRGRGRHWVSRPELLRDPTPYEPRHAAAEDGVR